MFCFAVLVLVNLGGAAVESDLHRADDEKSHDPERDVHPSYRPVYSIGSIINRIIAADKDPVETEVPAVPKNPQAAIDEPRKPLLAESGPMTQSRKEVECFQEAVEFAVIEFCTKDRMCGGRCSGGVFKGILTCSSSDEKCLRAFGVKTGEKKPVVVKFNEVGSEVKRGHLPASDTAQEVRALQRVKGHKNAVQLYTIIDSGNKERKLGNRSFWEPGMVMEMIDNGTTEKHFKRLATRYFVDTATVSKDMMCIMDQVATFANFMIHENFYHADMHYRNIMLSSDTFNDVRRHTCNVVKVIDFGVITTLEKSNDKIDVLSMLAQDLDDLTAQMISAFDFRTQYAIVCNLHVSEVVNQIFTQILSENETAVSTELASLKHKCEYGAKPHCKALITLAEKLVNRQP